MILRACVESLMRRLDRRLGWSTNRPVADGELDDLVQVRRSTLIVCHEALQLAKDTAVTEGHMNAGQLLEDASSHVNWALYREPYLPTHTVRHDSHPRGDGVSQRERDTRTA